MTIYYVDGAVGNDANAGTSEGAGNAWATIQYAMDTVASGDHVYVKGSADYAEDVTVNGTSCSGTLANRSTTFEGYTSVPGDGGYATLTPTSFGFYTTNPCGHLFVKNFIIDGAGNYAIGSTPRSYCGADNVVVRNCGNGIIFGTYSCIANCVGYNITGNGNQVFRVGSYSTIVGCTAFNYHVGQAYAYFGGGSSCQIHKCLAVGGYIPVQINTTGAVTCCTLDGETEGTLPLRGIGGGNYNFYADNIVIGATQYLIHGETYGPKIYNNLAYNFTGTAANIFSPIEGAAGIWFGPYADNNVVDASAGVADLKFTNTALGDYTLGAGSPAIDTGSTPKDATSI